MCRPAFCDDRAVALDLVLVAEACAAEPDAAGVHDKAVVEAHRLDVTHVRLEHDRFDTQLAQPAIAAGVALQVLDARNFEPHEVVRVVRDALCVRFGEADANRR